MSDSQTDSAESRLSDKALSTAGQCSEYCGVTEDSESPALTDVEQSPVRWIWWLSAILLGLAGWLAIFWLAR